MRTRDLLLLLLLLVAIPACADSVLLHATNQPHAVPSGARRTMLVTEDGEFEIWKRASPGVGDGEPAAFDLEFCGQASRAERMIERWSDRWGDRPVEVWAVNYPGFGGSSGPACLAASLAVAEAAFDHAVEEAAGRPVFVGGSSLGTAFAIHLAAQRNVAGVVARNPPPLRELILWRHGWWNFWLLATPIVLQIPAGLDSVTNAEQSSAPIVFLSARRDDVVPSSYQRLVYDAYAGPKSWLEFDGTHSSRLRAEDDAARHEAVAALFDRVVGGGGGGEAGD